MSFLGKKIQGMIQTAREGKITSGEIHSMKEEIEEQLLTLYRSDDLRIFDNENGGALRGPVESRQSYEFSYTENEIFLGCDPQNIDKNNMEVPYTRALFNSNSIGDYQLMSYEAPLMRKRRENTNPDISGRQVSCDLIGINKNEICCIEVKVDPFKDACLPAYALLEGFAYSVCMNWILRINPLELSQEIKLCCKHFKANASHLPEKATFAIAAPIDEYFLPYWKAEGQSEEWFKRRKQEAEALEDIILSEYRELFSGYLALAPSTTNIETTNAKNTGSPVIPTMPNPTNSGIKQPFVKKINTFFQEM